MSAQKNSAQKCNINALVSAFRKEIEEYGMLLNLIYDQQNCILSHNPISLLQATSKIEEQLPANQLATAHRSALLHQFAEDLGQNTLPLNELPKFVPNEFQSLFKALVEELVSLRYRIKSKTQLQQRLLGQAQVVNTTVLKHIQPLSQTYDKKGQVTPPSSFKEVL